MIIDFYILFFLDLDSYLIIIISIKLPFDCHNYKTYHLYHLLDANGNNYHKPNHHPSLNEANLSSYAFNFSSFSCSRQPK